MSIGGKVNYYFTGTLIILLVLFTLFASPVYPDTTQTNVSGSNTAIEGGYTSTATTTYETGSESSSTTNNTTNSDIKSSPPSASAPSYNAMTQENAKVVNNGEVHELLFYRDINYIISSVYFIC